MTMFHHIVDLHNTTLATATTSGLSFQAAFEQFDLLTNPDKLLNALSALPMIYAPIIIVVGILCVLNGYQWHKWVVVTLALLLGLFVGHLLSQQMGRSIIVAVSLGILFAIIATPMLRWTVAVFGGLTGAFLGANAWTLVNASPADAQWACACMGFIALAMLSFVVFRLVVVLFTSVGGGAMVVLGSIALLMHVPNWDEPIRQSLTANPYLVPLLVTVAAVAGFVLQESRVRQASSADGNG